jgi:hypothetical protein
MGHWSTFACALSLTGCSLIYNPSNLPDPASDALQPDVTPDMPVLPVDADPAFLEVTDVSPKELLEGQGVEGSRRAVLVLTGVNFVSGATVAVTAHAGETATPLVTVHNADAVVSTDGLTLAVPVTVDVDPAIGPVAPATVPSIRLDVSVTQATSGEPITKVLDHRGDADEAALTLKGLREQLGGGTLTIDLAQAKQQFSKIEATSLAFTGTANIPVIESVSSLSVTDPILVNANGQTAGIGGGNGGLGGQGVVGAPGSAGTGDGRGLPDGGGASFGSQGGAGQGSPGSIVGAASLPTLASPNRGSGGAGNKGNLLNTRGGNGGGGGGTIALTAGSDLTFSTINANGGNGTSATGTTGGGGSGGSVLLRAGKTITVTKGGAGVTAKGGTGAGIGGDGRVRFDAGQKSTDVQSDPLIGHRGAMADFDTPIIVRDQTPTIVFNGQPESMFTYTVEDAEATTTRGPVSLQIPGGGTLSNHSLAVDLFRGVSILCVRVEGATGSVATGKNCVTIVFVP